MFSDIKSISTSKIVEAREFIEFLSSQAPAPPLSTPRHVNTGKGMLYVQLYGIIEYTVHNTVSKAINFINLESIKIDEIKPIILSLVLNEELDSLIHVSSKKWDKRLLLFDRIDKNSTVAISSDLMPTNGKNIRYAQLESIWKIFCIAEPILHDNRFGGRLKDIVDNRNNIAHGILSPSDVGSRVTFHDLSDRLNEVSTFCSYFILTFEDYISNKKYKK